MTKFTRNGAVKFQRIESIEEAVAEFRKLERIVAKIGQFAAEAEYAAAGSDPAIVGVCNAVHDAKNAIAVKISHLVNHENAKRIKRNAEIDAIRAERQRAEIMAGAEAMYASAMAVLGGPHGDGLSDADRARFGG